MGTNYYTKHNEGGNEYTLHIGKKSAGCVFTLRGYINLELHSWPDWKRFLQDKKIANEYCLGLTLEEFEQIVLSDSGSNIRVSDGTIHGRRKRSDEPPWCVMYGDFC